MYINKKDNYGGIFGRSTNTIRNLTIKEGYIFVMGDNRNNSQDSRHEHIGQVSEKNILGKAVLRIYPFNAIGGIE